MGLYTKLNVVNRGLNLMGQLPVNDLETLHPAIPAILAALDNANKQVQSRTWWFNTETLTLVPQVGTKRISIPNDTVAVDATDPRLSVAQRGRYLYDTANGTFEFSSPVEVKLHRLVDFDDLPPTAAAYVITQALRETQSGLDGDGQRYRDLLDEDARMFAALTAEDTRFTQANLLRRPGVQLGLGRINQNTPFPYRR